MFLNICSHCEGKECQGHQLPVFPRIIMHELDHPKDLPALTEAASKWFDRIDDDLGGTLSNFFCFGIYIYISTYHIATR